MAAASVTANFANNFSAVNYGTDGAGTTTYKLELSAASVGSGLFALDASDKETVIDPLGKGSEIQLSQTPDGVIHGKLSGLEYFTISVDGSGVVTFTGTCTSAGCTVIGCSSRTSAGGAGWTC